MKRIIFFLSLALLTSSKANSGSEEVDLKNANYDTIESLYLQADSIHNSHDNIANDDGFYLFRNDELELVIEIQLINVYNAGEKINMPIYQEWQIIYQGKLIEIPRKALDQSLALPRVIGAYIVFYSSVLTDKEKSFFSLINKDTGELSHVHQEE